PPGDFPAGAAYLLYVLLYPERFA
ncbi:potassium-transporting ATPase subunit F, partial [Faecalibacterium prausnitzii]|nr:potassium-transporting ATPase subunit F [Faecalibacterium prausnitzii]